MIYLMHDYWWVTFEQKTYGPFSNKEDARSHLHLLHIGRK